MSSPRLPNIPSLRRYQLLLELASLKHAPPPGVYVSLTPGDITAWTGVLFIRTGPYASAILRFHIRFPASYPDLPPLVTFTTDIFHPLIVPLTTYTFTTGSLSGDPVSARDEERLPPGGFSLRHGFPHWFGRTQRSPTNSTASSRNVSGSCAGALDEGSAEVNKPSKGPDGEDWAQSSTPKAINVVEAASPPTLVGVDNNLDRQISVRSSAAVSSETKIVVPVVLLLDYVRSTFEDETILDALPLEAAGNPGAWHAWRAHRRSIKGKSEPRRADGLMSDAGSRGAESLYARLPGEWNWEGVWAKRVRGGIEASQSDAILFGNATRGGGDDMIRFSNMDDATLADIKDKLISQSGDFKMT